MWEIHYMRIWSLSQEDPLTKEGMATHSSIPAWTIPWTKEPGKLQSIGSQSIRCDWAIEHAYMHTIIYCYLTKKLIQGFCVMINWNDSRFHFCKFGKHWHIFRKAVKFKQKNYSDEVFLNQITSACLIQSLIWPSIRTRMYKSAEKRNHIHSSELPFYDIFCT